MLVISTISIEIKMGCLEKVILQTPVSFYSTVQGF